MAKSEQPVALRFPNESVEVQPQAEGGAAREHEQFLAVETAGELFALRIDSIREIDKPLPITPVPCVPHYFLGVAAVRGEMLPVIDLARRLDLFRHEPEQDRQRDGKEAMLAARRQRIVIVKQGEAVMGLRVDQVLLKLSVPTGTVEPTPAMIGSRSAECICGVFRHDGQVYGLLDVDAIADTGESEAEEQ